MPKEYEFLKTTPNNFQLESGRTEVELEENAMSGSQSLWTVNAGKAFDKGAASEIAIAQGLLS